MIEHLKWDSEFFGRKIGKLEIKGGDEIVVALNENIKKFDLVYIFSDRKLNQSYNLVDIKVKFQKKVGNKFADKNIVSFNSSLHNYEELLKLAYQSGHDSRFLKDPFFGEIAFKKLYKTWVDKSIESSQMTILLYVKKNKIIGFVSFKDENTKSNIELIAVNPKARGQGVGNKLLDAVEAKLKRDALLTVPTQETNTKAYNFYLKNKFKIISKQYIYHYEVNSI